MSKKNEFDVAVIGSGAAGFSAALAAAEIGAKVVIIEKENLGGECPNFGCIPSKALLKTAKVYQQIKKARNFGFSFTSLEADFIQVMSFRRKAVAAITGEHGQRYVDLLKKKGIKIEQGTASFLDQSSVTVGEKIIDAKTFVIASGSIFDIPPIRGLKDVHFWTSKEAIVAKKLPKTLGIIGGGPVGCELATFFAAFGTRVLIFDVAPRLLDKEDKELSAAAENALQAAKIEIFTQANILEIVSSGASIYGLRVEQKGTEKLHAVDQILVATGKHANIQGLGLEKVMVGLTERGAIKTSSLQKTSAGNIFAAGDVGGGAMYTRAAHMKGEVAGHNAALCALRKQKGWKKTKAELAPHVTFIDPELAAVGMTQEEVKKKYGAVLVGRYPIAALGRAVVEDEHLGLVKLVAHPKSRKILGGHIFCSRAGEMIHEAALAIELQLTLDKLAAMAHAFPTFSEAIGAAAGAARIE